jgi:hypothetical protein
LGTLHAVWYEMNSEKLLATTAESFIFNDPVEPEPVTQDVLVGYMHRWDERTRSLGGDNQWVLRHEVRQDKDGILTDWELWEMKNTGMSGAAIVLTSDEGVLSETITYFDRNIRHPQT